MSRIWVKIILKGFILLSKLVFRIFEQRFQKISLLTKTSKNVTFNLVVIKNRI